VNLYDKVRTNKHWNANNEPIHGKITKIIPSRGMDLPIVELNYGRYRLNEFWLELE